MAGIHPQPICSGYDPLPFLELDKIFPFFIEFLLWIKIDGITLSIRRILNRTERDEGDGADLVRKSARGTKV